MPPVAEPPIVSLELRAYEAGTGRAVEVPWAPLPSPLTPYLQPGDGVLDLGANVGQMARTFAQAVGPTGAVLAVEPYAPTAMMALLLAEPYPQIRVLPVACGGAHGVRALCLDTLNPRRHSLWAENLTTPSAQSMLVPMVTLDTLAEQVPNLRAIKVDTQGAEAEILDGAAATLQRHDVTWLVELWAVGLERAGASLGRVIEQFWGHGWQPVGVEWWQIRERAEWKPHGVQNVLLRHREAV